MQWTRGHTIGHGSTATVSIATTTISHHRPKTFAVKSVELSKSELLQTETKMLSSLNHPCIVSYQGCDITFENNNHMFNLKMEYMSGGSLSDTIKKSGGRLDESTIRCYTRQIIEGLDYLHSIGVVHCDIKGQNILTGENGSNNCKIADFGCAKWLTPANPFVPMAGTPLFMSPEVARGLEQRYPADIWSVGCTILEMFTGFSPWPNATNATSLLYQIGILCDSPEIPENISDEAKDFLNKCLIRDPKERWTAKQLLKHQFINGIVSSNLKMGNQDLCSNSPTSILDLGLWNSVDESTTLLECMKITDNSPALASPDRRLGLWMLNSDRPNWICDENWITVRSRGE